MAVQDTDTVPWLAEVLALLRAAVSAELPTLGVCLGAQLLAAAHGGRVQPDPDSQEFGAQLVAKRAAAGTDPLFSAVPITPDVIQWHFDSITQLPPGAIQLASSPVCENQAFRVGRLAWGIQFHIETTSELVRQWLDEDAELLEGYDLDTMSIRLDAAHVDIEEVWRPFAARFADVVRDPSAVLAARGGSVVTAAPVTDPAAIRAALAAELTAARAPHPPALSMPLPMPEPRSRRDG
jgi:GMP synthase-like glutamine amidotransferase